MLNKKRNITQRKMQELMQQKVICADGMIVTVEEVLGAYQQAHPTWHVSPLDAGEQVFIGDQLTGTGLWLDKVVAESESNTATC